MLDENLSVLLNKAYFFLKFRPRSKREVEKYLYKKIKNRHWSSDDVKKVIRYLEEENLINDKDFVRWFVEQRMILKPKSVFVLKQELLKYGIDKNIIEEHFSNYEIDEEHLAEKTLSQRWRQYKNLDKKKRFEKAASFLLRRGFNFEIVGKVINKLEKNQG